MSVGQIFGTPLRDSKWFEEDASVTMKLVQEYLPRFEPKIELDLQHGWWTVALPCPTGAEYQFSLHGELGGERQVSARLTEFRDSYSRHGFWYSALELADFRDDASTLQNIFHELVRALMAYPTRITEKKGVLWLSYRAEYQKKTGWQRLRGGVKYLGLGFGVPFIGKKRVYTSPPVVSWAEK